MRKLLTLLLTAILFFTFSPVASAETLAPYYGTGARKTILFGDSLMGQTALAYRNLTQSSYQSSYNALGGARMQTWLPYLDEAVAEAPNAIIAALGVNDYRTPNQLAYWQQAGQILQGKCWVWVEYYQPLLNSAAIQWANQVRPIVVGFGGIVYRAWNDNARLNPQWFQSDKIHLTASGVTAYAQHLRAAQAKCP